MNIELLISTMNKEKLESLRFENIDKSTNCLVINQCGINKNIEKKNLRMIKTDTVGLAKSRNLAIKYAKGNVCIISDDDVKYVEGFEKLVEDEFEKNPDIDILTFQIKTPEGDFFKNYREESFQHNHRTVLKISSIEIAFRLNAIKDNNIFFNEYFGLGANYISGEENIFLLNCIKKGLKIKYIPKTIAIHPKESSGKILDKRAIYSKGALFYELFGFKAYFINFAFLFKKRKLINFNFLESILLIYLGMFNYVYKKNKYK